MNIMHKKEIFKGKERDVIYVSYPAEYEFGLDFDSFKQHVQNIVDNIRKFAVEHASSFSPEGAVLVLNGVAMGSIVSSKLTLSKKGKT